jgi:hypothetical protein
MAQMGCNHLKKGGLTPFFFMDTRIYIVRIGILGSINVQAASKWQAEDRVWTRVQAGEYGKLAQDKLTRKDISVA